MKISNLATLSLLGFSLTVAACSKNSSGSSSAKEVASAPNPVEVAKKVAGSYQLDAKRDWSYNANPDWNKTMVLTLTAGTAGGTFTSPLSGDRGEAYSGKWTVSCSSTGCGLDLDGAPDTNEYSIDLAKDPIEIIVTGYQSEAGGYYVKQ